MGSDRTVSFWRDPDRSGSDLAVGHWAPIESVVNDDGPDKSVIIPLFFRLTATGLIAHKWG
jgi:hypothetical protein